jgi:hypothetical protein
MLNNKNKRADMVRYIWLVRRHPVGLFFVVVAVVVRLAFWLYTDRIWEDALITLTPARNLWEGNGLTHHISEPRIHSFTSPISVLVPIIGEAFGHGLLFLRLVSVAASAGTIVIAYRIGRYFGWGLPSQILVLGFLALDQLQIFFGMSGMETQIATMVILAGFWALVTKQWSLLGLMLGVAALSRPEFGLWILVIGVGLIFKLKKDLIRPAVLGVSVLLPWIIFTTAYYGSPIPHTIVAKNLYPWAGGGARLLR